MDEGGHPGGIDAASLGAGAVLPAVRTLDGGWDGVLVRGYDEHPATAGFDTVPTPDLLFVLVTNGTYRIESRRPGGWASARYRPGSVGVTAPGASARLRWRAAAGERPASLQVHVGAGLLARTRDELGLAPDGTLPDALELDDPYVSAAVAALGRAVTAGVPPVHPESVTRALLGHVLLGLHRPAAPADPADPAPLGDAALARVVELMRAGLAEPLTLEALAAAAHLSPWHFLRRFRAATGTTPHRYLVELRLHEAARLLAGPADLTVEAVARRCGYRSAGQFGAAFRRRFGVTPARYRAR